MFALNTKKNLQNSPNLAGNSVFYIHATVIFAICTRRAIPLHGCVFSVFSTTNVEKYWDHHLLKYRWVLRIPEGCRRLVLACLGRRSSTPGWAATEAESCESGVKKGKLVGVGIELCFFLTHMISVKLINQFNTWVEPPFSIFVLLTNLPSSGPLNIGKFCFYKMTSPPIFDLSNKQDSRINSRYKKNHRKIKNP